MNRESEAYLISQYRTAALDEPSGSLDRAILTQARRRGGHVRIMRRGVALCAMLVIAVALVNLYPRPHAIKAGPMPARVDDDGLYVGTTRYDLMTVSAVPSGEIDSR
jgi:hypothetical protein